MTDAFIVGSASALPETIVTNEELGPALGLTAEQIFQSSGIRRRHYATPGMPTSQLAAEALRLALENARLEPSQVDYLLLGTMTPDRQIPGTAPAIQHRLGLGEIPCLDIRAACCNFLYAMQLARALIVAKSARHIAICVAEIQSPWLSFTPEEGTLSMLFGDGAAAAIISAEPQPGAWQILEIELATAGQFADDLGLRCPGTEFGANGEENPSSYFQPHMRGQNVIVQASRRLTTVCRHVMQRHCLTADKVQWLVPHQANTNLLTLIARQLGFQTESGMVLLLEGMGNTSSASMGMALDFLRRADRVRTDDYILLPAFGAGFSWGAGLCRSL